MHRYRNKVVLAFGLSGLLTLPFWGPSSRSIAVTPPRQTSQSTVILEVMNYHFTVGKKIPSLFLRVFSDGAIEAQPVWYGDEKAGEIEKKALTPDQFASLKTALDDSQLRGVGGRYELQRMVIDSWMEWEIKIPRAPDQQSITLSFAPTSSVKRPYPGTLRNLACVICKLHSDLIGDDVGYYEAACHLVNSEHPIIHPKPSSTTGPS